MGFDPVTMLMVGATAFKAIGQIGSGMYSAQVAENNKTISLQNRDYALKAGAAKAGDQSIKNAQREAKIKTGFAANNIVANTGSAVDVQASQKAVDALDVERILQDAGLTAYGYETQATNYEAKAKQDRAGAIWGAAGTLLEGAAQFGGGF